MSEATTNIAADLALDAREFDAKYAPFRENLLTASRVQGMLRTADTLASHVEDLWLGRAIHKEVSRPIFVTGNYRSGSTMLERILSHHSDLGYFTYLASVFPRSPAFASTMHKAIPDFSRAMVAPHHPNMVIHADWPEEAELVWRLCANNPWSDSPCNVLDAGYSDPAFERIVIRTINKQLFLQRAVRFLNKNPLNTIRVGFLARLFPSAQFVHIVRHPYRMLRSQLDMVAIFERLLPMTGLDYGEMFRSLHIRPAKIFARTPDDARIRAALAHDGDLAAALSIADVERVFHSMVEADDLGPRVLVIRYEDLMEDFAPQMRRVFEFVGLGGEASEAIIADCDRGFVDRSLISAKTTLSAVSAEVRAALESFLDRHGYD